MVSELVCECGFEAKSGAGLAAHSRSCGDADLDVSVLAAVKTELEDVESPEAAAALTIAEAIDRSVSARDLPRLSQELRELLSVIRGSGSEEKKSAFDELAERRAGRTAS